MSYLLDRKIKRKKFLKIALGVLVFFILIYFRGAIFHGFSYAAHAIFRPILIFGNNVGDKLSNAGLFFNSKKSLQKENENLKAQLNEVSAKASNYNSVLEENDKLKEILGRKSEKMAVILSAILSKPDQSPYDTLIIDAGANQNIVLGSRVFALGDVPIGRVEEVLPNSSKVILFSNPGEKNVVVISGKDAFMDIVGRGGGNFEMVLPRDFTIEKGTEVHLPGAMPYTLAVVETIISDPRDAFQKALLASPVNVQELGFIQVESQK